MQEISISEIRDDFFRDSFAKVIFVTIGIGISIISLLAIGLYLYLEKPPPVVFQVDNEWRVQPSVPLNQPYLSTPDMLQWVTEAMSKVFVFDFLHYSTQLQNAMPYFTADGWKVFLNQVNNYASLKTIQAGKLFVNGVPGGAPFALNQGLLSGRYAWWVQIPISLRYVSNLQSSTQTLTFQVLVVRTPTLNNLMGVAIDNLVLANNTGKQP